jgi:predicted ester cyclase
MSSPEHNIATVRAATAAITNGDLEALVATVTPNYKRIDLANTLAADGPEQLMELIAGIKAGIPDFTFEIEKAIATEDDHVAIIFRMSGHHLAEFYGAAPTGRFMQIKGMGMYRLVDGRIEDNWQLLDTLGMMTQLTAAPSAPQPEPAAV